MRLVIVDRRAEPDGVARALVERRLRLSMSRFATAVERIQLVIAAASDSDRPGQLECRLTIRLRNSSSLVVRDCDFSLLDCVARVADRATRTVARRLSGRQPTLDRLRPRMSS